MNNRRIFLKTTALTGIGFALAGSPLPAWAATPPADPIRVGIIGRDTEHSVAFTNVLNDPAAAEDVSGFRVVAAYPYGSKDIEFSVQAIPRFSEEIKKWGVAIVSSIEELLGQVDVVLLETNDGRLHLEQVLDHPEDANLWKIDDQYMMGDQIMYAPFIDGASTCEVYFPKSVWYDFNTNKKYEGGKKYTITMSLDEIPMFVKQGAILPLAEPVEYITPKTAIYLSCKVYGADSGRMKLFRNNSGTFDYEKGQFSWSTLVWEKGAGSLTHEKKAAPSLYKVISWEKVD